MIRFVKIFNSKITGYWYFPENNKAPGMIEINTKTGDVDIVIESILDQELEYPIYANKAKSYVKRLFDSGDMPDEENLVWY
ncbi:MAG: hypothetical protein E6510_00105 [Gemella haemolysans]|uniref:hypothetical protein n=1 Tax=Gemella haemolysans TaxID=1379 RepID=UPI002912F260|nr:hypothetical protein [Gemella haemolysans]MDU6572603.1 hypothetical protein [Gemella haemolysans]